MSRNLRLQLIMDAAGNATRFLKGVRGETDSTSKALRAARERISELQRASKDVAAYRQMTDRLGQTRESLKAARAEAARLAQAHKAAANPTKALTRAFEQARDRVRSLKATEEGHARTLQSIRGRLESAGLSTRNLSEAEKRLALRTRRATDALEEQRSKLKALEDRQNRLANARTAYDKRQQFAGTAAGAGASSIGAGMAAAAPLVAASGAAISFQDAMLDVKKVVDFDTPEQFEQMNRDVLQLSNDLGLPAEGIAQIIAAAGQAKIAREELKGFAQDAGQMGVAFGTTAEDAGEKMATWRTAFGMTQDQVRAFADQVNYLGDNGNATALAISDVVTRVGPLGGVAGLAAAEVAALGSTIVGMGVAEEVAATGIKNTMLALTKGEAATKAQRKAYAALGLEAEGVAKAMQSDAGGTIIDVLERVKKLSPDRQASILTQLFGSESVAAIAPMLTQLDVLKINLNAVEDAEKTAGSMATEFGNRMSGAKGAIDQATEGLKGSATAAGFAFLPAIREIALRVSAASKRLTEFALAHPRIIQVVGVLVGIVAAGLLVFGGLALAVAAVLGPFALLQFALAGAGAFFAPLLAGLGGAIASTWAFTAALLANPITWIVVGVVALAAAAFLIYRNWGAISTWWAGVWSRIKEIGGAAVRGLISVFMTFTPAGLLIQAFQRVWPALQSLGPKFREFGGQLIMGLINGLLGGIPNLIRAVMGAGGKLITAFKERLGIRSPSRVFAGLGDDTVAGLTQGLTRSSGDALRAVARVGAGMTAALAVGTPGAPSLAFDNGPRIGVAPAPAASAPPATRPSIGSVTINVNAQPGQSARDIAREVAEILNNPNLGELGDEPGDFD
ncbi:phage tail tape measure protein [Brevundimonas diminuta]|uniref:phage tail tape measure protein n=1 Tax=Brevundimonas diminuta TaxID=293 RepID=UPI00320950E3